MKWNRQPMGPPDTLYSLWYYPGINRFSDDDGNILHDLSDKFDVWQLDEWKRTHDYAILKDKQGNWCELFYPSEFEDWDFITHGHPEFAFSN